VSPNHPDEDFKKSAFVPCGPTQEQSTGWVPPRGHEHGALVERVAGATIVKLMIETKSVPGHALREAADAKAKEIEAATGRKPGKKETRDIMDELLLSMLPKAFAKRSTVTGWITLDGFLILDTASQSRADAFISELFKTTDGLTVSPLQTTTAPQAAMTQWMLAETADEWPNNLNVERECVLKSQGEDAAIVKFTKHHLSNPDVRKHVTEGKLPTELALSWDGRIAFVLTDALRLKKVQYLDGVMDESGTDKMEDRFDADVTLATGLLGTLLDDLIYALGGEMDQEGGAA
jgi:recombination associated protein RdgC